MATKIAWCEETWNPIVGCSKVSPGCTNCYAEKMAVRQKYMEMARDAKSAPQPPERYSGVIEMDIGWNGKTAFVESALTQPLHWRKPKRIFVCSMSDLFHETVPDEWIDKVFAVMALAPQHTFVVLTKRAKRMRDYMASFTGSGAEYRTGRAAFAIADPNGIDWDWKWRKYEAANNLPEGGNRWPLPNVWLGTTCEDQQRADERIPELLATPAAVRFLSVEPLLGAVNLRLLRTSASDMSSAAIESGASGEVLAINWVIVGGESGPKARPCNVDWIRSIVGQCKAAGVPVFVKQLGADAYTDLACQCGYNADKHWKGPAACPVCAGRLRLKHPKGGDMAEWPEDLRVREYPKVVA